MNDLVWIIRMICLWISIVIGFVNDFVTENKRFGKVGACMWANRRRGRACEIFFYFAKISFVPGRELPGQMDKGHLSRMLNPG